MPTRAGLDGLLTAEKHKSADGELAEVEPAINFDPVTTQKPASARQIIERDPDDDEDS